MQEIERLEFEFEHYKKQKKIDHLQQDWSYVGHFIDSALGYILNEYGQLDLTTDKQRELRDKINALRQFLERHGYEVTDRKRFEEMEKIRYEKNKIRIEAFTVNPIYKVMTGIGLGIFSTTTAAYIAFGNVVNPSEFAPYGFAYFLAFLFIFEGLFQWNRQEKEKKSIYHTLFKIRRPQKQ